MRRPHLHIQVSARYATFAGRSKWSMDSLLFSFVCQCRGVKFYDLRNAGRRWGTKLSLVREPTNLRDPLCVTGLDVTICDRPRQNQPYCAGPQSEIRVKIVAQGEY